MVKLKLPDSEVSDISPTTSEVSIEEIGYSLKECGDFTLSSDLNSLKNVTINGKLNLDENKPTVIVVGEWPEISSEQYNLIRVSL